jgi:hypothetical protein
MSPARRGNIRRFVSVSRRKTMQAQMTGQPMPTSRKPLVRNSLVILAFLTLIGLGVHGYNAGWFKHTASKASELFATAATSVGQFFSKTGDLTGTSQPAVARNANNPDEMAVAIPPSTQSGDVTGENPPAIAQAPFGEDNLSKARSAYAAGDINTAIETYRTLIASNPDNIAALGELGNVFYAVRMMPAAAQAYFDAASKAIDQNQFEVAENLLPAIMEGNPMLATQLNDKLFEVHARANMGQPWQPMPATYQPYQPYQPPMPPFMQPGDQQ